MKALTVFLVLYFGVSTGWGQIAPEKVITEKKHRVWCLDYNKSGSLIASGGDDAIIYVYKTSNYSGIARLDGLKGIPISVCFSNDGKKIAAGGKDNKITVWNLENGQIVREFIGHKLQVMDIEFSPNDEIIASGSYDKTIKLWNMNTGELQATLEGHTKEINTLDFSPNGEYLISGSGDKTIKVWNVAQRGLFLNIPAHESWVRCVKYSPDGSIIASGGDDRKIQLWDAVSGKQINTFLGHKNWVMSLDFSPDGGYLLSGGQDNLIILTDLKTGKMVYQSESQSEKILAIAFNPNGESFAFAALFDEKMQIWNAKSLGIKPIDLTAAKQASSKSGLVPTVAWINPNGNLKSTQASLVAHVNIKSESSLRKIELWVNNALFMVKDRAELMLESSENGMFDYKELVVLNEGENTIQVKVINIAGEGVSPLIKVLYNSHTIDFIAWNDPTLPRMEVNTPQTVIKAAVLKGEPGREVTLLLNGKAFFNKKFDGQGGDIVQSVNWQQGENKVSFRLKVGNQTVESETKVVIYTPATKPLISWLNPTTDTNCYISSINVKAGINSKIPLTKLEIQLNGQVVYSKGDLAENTLVLDRNIQIPTGTNSLQIIAANQSGETYSAIRKVLYQEPIKTNISWIAPMVNSDVYQPNLNIKACIQSKAKVLAIKAYNNNNVVYSMASPALNKESECNIDLNASIVLNPGNNSLKIELEHAGGLTHSEVINVNYQIPKLATINWLQLNNTSIKTSKKEFDLQACIATNAPLELISVIANNQIINIDPIEVKATEGCAFTINELLVLQKGSNMVMVKVKNYAGESYSQPLFIEYTIANPYKFALIIGNEDYSSYQTGINNESNVDFAINDARSFKNLCVEKFGIPEEKIIYQENARQMEMIRAVNKLSLLIKASEGKAEVLVFYAGHGFPDEKTKEPYLIPVDVSGSDLAFGGGIQLTKFYDLLTEFQAKRVTVFLDACFSGGARNQGLVAARGVKIVPKETQAAVKKNLVVFAASSGNESSLPYREKKHGMFTYYLLKKLEESNGQVNYDELSNYLKNEVNVNSLLINNKEQQPQTNISAEVGEDWKTWTFNE